MTTRIRTEDEWALVWLAAASGTTVAAALALPLAVVIWLLLFIAPA